MEKLNLYEEVRNILLQTERIQNQIAELKHKRLYEVLSEMLKTCQADLMVFLDTVYELEQCESDSEINELMESYSDCENETVN